MIEKTVIRRLEAFRAGRPLPQGTTIHFKRRPPAETFLLAFLRMGGESTPWGFACGTPGTRPVVRTVPEPRNRDLVAALMAELASHLLAHLAHPATGGRPDASDACLPHVWLPNASHLEMVHHIAYTYRWVRRGDPARIETLSALGRACTWLFLESQRPGTMCVFEATRALQEAFVFPAEDVRQAHLGFLLAWLDTKGGREARARAASDAESLSMSTNIDPAVENTLEDPVAAFRAAQREDDERGMRRTSEAIHRVLAPELERRFALLHAAHTALARDRRPDNPGVSELVEASEEQHQRYLTTEGRFLRGERAFSISPETDDRATWAALRFHLLEESQERHWSSLVHHDADLLDDAIAEGNAFRGRIARVVNEGGKKRIPVWTIESAGMGPLRLREEEEVCEVGEPRRTAKIRLVRPIPDGGRLFELEITNLKKESLEPHHTDREIAIVRTSRAGLLARKRQELFNVRGPGSWLTQRDVRFKEDRAKDDSREVSDA